MEIDDWLMFRSLRTVVAWAGLIATRCPICGVLTEEHALCPGCAQNLTPRIGGHCPGCGELFGDNTAIPSLCGECRTTPQPWTKFYFHGLYSGVLRELILGYKFNNRLGSTQLLGTLAQETIERMSAPIPSCIIPVPLHRRRLLWRGFNQSVEICRALGKKFDRPVLLDGLKRIRNTRPQTRLGLKERQENIKSAFTANREKVEGKSLLLVDDVYTTGATLRECTKTLLQAGAHHVEVLVLARAM